jgi:hypothetical protein
MFNLMSKEESIKKTDASLGIMEYKKAILVTAHS